MEHRSKRIRALSSYLSACISTNCRTDPLREDFDATDDETAHSDLNPFRIFS